MTVNRINRLLAQNGTRSSGDLESGGSTLFRLPRTRRYRSFVAE